MPEPVELDYKIKDPVVTVNFRVLQEKILELENRIYLLENP